MSHRSPLAVALAIALASSSLALAEAPRPDSGTESKTLDRIEVREKRPSYTAPATVAGKTAMTLREIPNSVSVITRQRIEDQNLITIADVLNQVTGVTVTSNDGTQSQYRARGYTMGVMNDGIPAYGSASGYQQFDAALYERIEVLRGPGGVLQGSGDPGGTINYVRKRGLDHFHGNASASVGRWDSHRAAIDVGAPLNASGSVRSRFVGSWQDRDFHWQYTHNRRWLGYGALDVDLGEQTTLSVALATQDDRTDAPYSGLPAWSNGTLINAPRDTNVSPPWAKYLWTTHDYQLGLDHRFGNDWTAKAQVSQKDQRFFFHDGYTANSVDMTDNSVPYARREYDYDYQRRAADLFMSGPINLLGRRHQVLLGFNHDSFSSQFEGVARTAAAFQIRAPFGQPHLVPDFSAPYELGGVIETVQSGFYGQARLSVADPVTVVLGARSSDFKVRTRTLPPAAPTDWRTTLRETGEVTPYAGLVWDLNRTYTLYASYADIFLPQSQLKVDGSTLDPRIGKQHEFGAKADYFDGRLLASLATFRIRDVGRSLADPDNLGFWLNAGEVQTRGWEVEATGNLAAGLDLQAGYTRLETEFLIGTAAQVGRSSSTWEPKHSFKLWLIHRPLDIDRSGLTLGAGLTTVSGSYASIGAGEIRAQGGHTVVSAMMGYRLDASWSFALNANNLLDKTYYTRLGGTNSYNTYGEPRNLTLTARYVFR